MTEYGRIHTDGSRSGGQPVVDTAMLALCPVPWCGSPNAKARSFDANHRRHWIECGKCNFKTPQMPSRTKVITLWNTRQPTQSDALREALADLLHAVCGETGFAETVRRDSGRIYPWPALDIAEAKAIAALDALGFEIREKSK